MLPGLSLSNARRSLVVILFVAALWAPLVGTWFGWSRFSSGDENRRLREAPKLTGEAKSWLDAPEQYNGYFQDNFGFRSALIKLGALIKVKLLGVSSSPSVIVGHRGWLYFTGDRSLESYRGLRPFTGAELPHWVQVFQTRSEWLARRNIIFLVVIVPDKQTVYPEHMPESISRRERPSRLDQLTDALSRVPGVHVIDAKSALLQAKSSNPNLYHLTDSHWNGFGMYYVYREMIREAAKTRPELTPIPLADTIKLEQFVSGDLTVMLGLQGILREHLWHVFSPGKLRSSGDVGDNLLLVEQSRNLPRLVMLRDSFGIELVSCLAGNFSLSAFKQGYDFEPELIAWARPDVVVVELAERRLNMAPPSNPVPAMRTLNRMLDGPAAPAGALPFGSVDTPREGAVVSGKAYRNFGWMLTPQPKIIPVDGSSIDVVIDGKAMGHPQYGQTRADLMKAFPDLNNGRIGAGVYLLDSTKLNNGRHTILWRASDNAGSKGETAIRTFNVQN